MKIVEGWYKHDPSTMKLERPDMRVQYDYRLALREAAWIRQTKTNHIRALSELTEIDALWEHDVGVAMSVLEWLEGYKNGLAPELRELVERTGEAPQE